MLPKSHPINGVMPHRVVEPVYIANLIDISQMPSTPPTSIPIKPLADSLSQQLGCQKRLRKVMPVGEIAEAEYLTESSLAKD